MNIGDPHELEELQKSLNSSNSHNKKQSYAERQQNISILQLTKPVIEFDIQISKEYSDKMVIFIDSVPEEIVEQFIVYNRMHPASFNPILMSVIEKMKEIGNQKDLCFTEFKDDKYYQVLMKKQLQLCAEMQNVKQMIKREKERGDQLINSKLSRSQVQNQAQTRDAISNQSPSPLEEFEDYQTEQSSAKHSTRPMTQRSPHLEISQFPQNAIQYNKDHLNNTTPIDQHQAQYNNDFDQDDQYEEQQERDPHQEDQPLQLYYDHLNLANQSNVHNIYHQPPVQNKQNKRSVTPKTKKVLENPKKAQKQTPSPSPPPTHPQMKQRQPISQLKFVRNGKSPHSRSNSPFNSTSPLKYPNEESYREKNDKKKNYYNHTGEPVDPREVSERLHKQKKEPPCSKYEPKKDLSEQECTFKPQINENSRALSKLYHQKQNAKNQKEPSGKENEQDLSQRLRSKSKGEPKHRNKDGNIEDDNQQGDSTIYQIVNSSQLKSSTNSQHPKRIQDDLPKQFPQQEQIDTSPQNGYNDHLYNFLPQNPVAPVYEKQINIREEIIYQHPERMYQPQRVSKLKQMQEHSVQTSEFINVSNDTPQNTNPIPFDPNLNQNYFKYLQMQEDIENEKEGQQESPHLLQSFSQQTSQPQGPLKKSFGIQTSEQIQQSKYNKSTSVKSSEMSTTERKPMDFDPNLNKNYFKYLQMQDDIEQERNELPHFAPQQSNVIQSKVLPHLSNHLAPPQPVIDKRTVSLQTSDYLMFLKSQQQKTEDGSDKENNQYSRDDTPKQQIPFDPNLNKNYFKFLQIEEDKDNDDDILKQPIKSNFQSKTSQSIDDKTSSQQSYHHINRKKYEEETPKAAIPFDPNLNQNYFKYLAMQDDKDSNLSLNSPQIHNQEEQVPQIKQFPEGRNSPFRRSPKSFQQPSVTSLTHQPHSSSIASNVSISDKNKNYKLNGSVFFCDEDPVTLQQDDPYLTNSQKQTVNKSQNNRDARQNLHQSNLNLPQEQKIIQQPDIAISSVRSVSPRIDKGLSQNQMSSVSPRNVNNMPPQKQFNERGDNFNKMPFQSGLQHSQSHSALFQSKVRGQITEQEQEALEEVYNTMKSQSSRPQLRKNDIDFYNLPFGVVLKSHIEIILKKFSDNEDITLQAFFSASEKSNNLSLFLNECVDFLKREKNI